MGPLRSRRPRARLLWRGWAVGVDVGGSWIRAVALDERGRRRAARFARRSAASPLPVMVRRAIAALRLGSEGAGALVVAARGVWTAAERRQARGALAALAPTVRIMSDVEAAYLGALGAVPGVLLLAGTGSIALGRDVAGRWHRAGGLGPLLGDDGSAFWIGRAWLRATAKGGDLGRLRRMATAPDAAARMAATAPAALRAARGGHRVARAIVRGAQQALAGTVVEVARRLRLGRPVPVSWAGSLLGDRAFRAGVWRNIRRTGLAIAPQPPAATAAEAAARAALSALSPTYAGPRSACAGAPPRHAR
jgi:glucosamine kinase